MLKTMFQRNRSTSCLSDLQFDRLLIPGDHAISAEARVRMRAHVANCQHCRIRYAKLQSAQANFPTQALAWSDLVLRANAPRQLRPGHQSSLQNRSASHLRESIQVRGQSRRTAGRIAQVAAALTLALGLWSAATIPSNPPTRSETYRSKGGWQLQYYVQRGGNTFRGDPSTPVHAGDRLRFAYSAPRTSHFAIVSIDARGAISSYFPQGPMMAQISAGQHRLLDSSVELDATLGTEQIDGIFCDAPWPIAELHHRVTESPLAPSLPPDCRRLRITVVKDIESL